MSIYKRTIIIICCIFVALMVVVYLASNAIYWKGFRDLENQAVEKNVTQVTEALSASLDALDTFCYDWSNWDDTYVFARGFNQEYVDRNFQDETFSSSELNLIAIYNTSGEMVYGKAYDLINLQAIALPGDVTDILIAEGLSTLPDTENIIAGIVHFIGQPMLIVSRPILTSVAEGPSTGAIIMGRSLDFEFIGALSETTHLSINLLPMPADTNSEITNIIKSLDESGPNYVEVQSNDIIAGYTYVNDLSGNPAFIFEVVIPRDINQQATEAITILHSFLLFIGVIFCIVFIVFMRKLVLSRLSSLSNSVSKIGASGDITSRVTVSGKDELSRLATNINDMLTSLETADKALRESEELLRENNEQLDTVLDSVPCGILVVDEETHIIQDVNSYASNIIGARPEEIIGRECHRFVCPAEKGRCPVSDLGKPIDNSERVLITVGGKSVPILKNVVRLTVKGNPYLLETFIDISERKKMESALRESEERFSLAFRSSPQEICITRIRDGKTIEINESFTRSTGYTREEIIGRSSIALNIWKPGERERMLAILNEQGRVENEEFEFRRKSGEIRTQLFSAEPLIIGGEECLISITTDITDRKRAEKLQADEILVLTLLGQGVELHELLNAIVRLGESHNPYVKGSVLLFAPSKNLLVHAAGPGLPPDYVEMLANGVPIGPNSGSCGTAAYRKERVVIPDIKASHAYPDEVVEVTIRNGLRSCWSQPIIASNGQLLGTIANYSSVVGEPSLADLRVIEWSARIAALAIERKNAEKALKESEEKFSKAFHASPDSISISRLSDGAFIEVNESYVNTIGYTRQELGGYNADDFDLWAKPEQRENMLHKIREHVIMHNEEIQIRTKAGEVRTQLISSEYVSLGGEPCLLVVGTDITERKRMEDSLADEATRRRILVDGSRDGIVILDQNGAVYEANRRFAEMLGYPPEEVAKLHVWDWEAASTKAQVMEMIRTVGEAGDHFTTRHRRKDGTAIDVEISTNGAMFAGQKLIFCVCRDISERNRMEKALRESEEKFSKAFYTIPEAISISRLSDGVFVEVNDTFTRVSGFPREKIIGHKSEELELWVNKNERKDLIRLIKARGRVENEEVQFLTRSGEVRTTLLSADIVNFSGEPCLLIVSNDISERKRAEEKLKAALTDLERSSAQLAATNKELETFSYSVSHDLRSPLRSIDGFSQALIEDYRDALDKKGRDYLTRLRTASQKMGELIDGILKLSRLTRSEMRHETIDLSSLAREIAGRLQETQPDRRVQFIIDDKLTANGDPQLMRVLLENLLSNAWKFTGKKPAAKIEFGTERRNGRQTFFIRDNGAGFDMSYSDKLFGAFQRLHEVTEFPGTGIGLATVQRIIHRHGGTIWAEAKVDKGATFHFTLDQRS